MSANAYTVLKVSESASEATIERAYQARMIDVQTNMAMSDAAKQTEMLAIEEANRVLMRSTSRELYDRQLAAQRNTDDASSGEGMGSKLIMIGVVLAIGGGGYYWMQQREAQHRLAEQERILIEQRATAASAAAAATRLKFDEQQSRDADERRLAEEKRLAEAQAQREREMHAEKFVGLPLPVPAKTQAQINRENFLRQYGELVELSEAEKQRLQAQQTADRQKRFVDQLAREDARAAEMRARAVDRENMRLKLEELHNQGK